MKSWRAWFVGLAATLIVVGAMRGLSMLLGRFAPVQTADEWLALIGLTWIVLTRVQR